MIKHITLFLLCFTLTASMYSQSDCEISGVTAIPQPCENGMFTVVIDFDIDNPQGEVFGIVGNATNYGFFMYEDLPIEIGPLPGDGLTDWQFIIYDLGEPNCQYTYTLGPHDCCTISDVVIDQITCTSMNAFRARINLEHSNTDSVGFQVYSSTGALLGAFLYSMLPVTVQNIPSFRIGTTHIEICDLGSSSCCTVVEFQDPDCNKTDCEIYNLNVVSGECDNGDFPVTLNFSYMLGGANFTVTGNGNNYGTFPYNALPLTLGPFEGDSTTEYVFNVVGAGMGNNCNASFDLGTVGCPPGCGFDNVDIQTMECRGDDAYSLTIDFVPISPGTQGFSVYAAGTFLGSFSYNDVPVLIDSFPSTGDFYDELVLCDNADPSCCFTYEFRALLCKSCVINQISVTPTVCDSNDQFHVLFDFYHYNEGEGFYIGGSGGIMGPFSYNSLPVELGPFDGDSATYYEFLVYDTDSSFCFNGAELGIIDCDCDFESITVFTSECTGNGFYSLFLDFTPIQVTHETFDVYAGDAFIGTFLYADLPILIPAFPNSGNATDIITICDHNTPTCCASYEYTSLDCFCGITDIVTETSMCDTLTNTFDLYLNFQWDGNVDAFEIFLGGDSIGIIQGANLPDTLFGLSTNIGTSVLAICAIGHPDCCVSVEVVNPCQGPCAITGLTVEALPCDSITKTFDIVVDFDWIGDYEMFEVYMDGVLIDSVAGVHLPDTFTGLTTYGDTVVFTVVAKNRPDCNTSVELVLDECRIIPCDITNLIAVPGVCANDSTFSIILDFFYEGFTEDSVDISTGSTYVGSFSVDSLPLILDAFPWDGQDTMTVTVCQTGDPACCETIEFKAPYCGCEVLSVSAEPLGFCNPNGLTFPVVIGAEWRGDVSSFTVYADTQLLAVIDAVSLPDTVFEFPVPTGEFAEVRLCGDDDSTCCATYSFVVPDCELCEITILTVDTFQCSGTTTFSAWIEYETIGVDGALQVWANDVYLGEFQQFHPLLLLNIPESDSLVVLRLCNAENIACCTEVEFLSMHCEAPPCEITGTTATVAGPDTSGAFVVTLDFEFANTGAAFTVFGNGNQYGVFTYDNVPLTLPALPCDSTTQWQFVVQDIQNTGCFDVIDLGLVKCDTTIGIFTFSPILPLEIKYSKDGAYFITPDDATELDIWTYDGHQIGQSQDIVPGDRISLSRYISMPGFYLVQVRSAHVSYVGKFVDFKD